MGALQVVPDPPELPGLTSREDLEKATLPSKWYEKKDNVNVTESAASTAEKIKGTRKYVCSLCKFTGRIETVLGHIEKEHKNKPPQKCNSCNYKTYSSKCMTEHKKHCAKDKNSQAYECDQCSYKTWKSWNFKRHQKSHTQKRTYECHLCHMKYKLKQGLRRHEKKVH